MSRYPHEITWSAAWWSSPNSGEFPSYPIDQVPPQGARYLKNFLLDNPGRIVPRGSLGGPNAGDQGTLNDTTNGGQLLATIPYDDYVFTSYRAPAATPKIDPWRAPINRSLTASDIAQPSLGATASRTVELNTGATTSISISDPHSIAGPRSARMGDAIYSPTFGGTATLVGGGSGYYAPDTMVHKNDLSSSVQLTHGPRFVQDVIDHAGRLWVLAARSPDGTDYDTSQAFYTIPGGTTGFTDVLTDWQDPDSILLGHPTLNFFSVGSANDGDFGVAYGRAGGNLVVFKRNSVWIFLGTDPSNYELVKLRDQNGCVDARSVIVTDEGTYFASQRGYELLTYGSGGSNFQLLTAPIADQYLMLSNGGPGNNNINHGFIRATQMPNNYIHLALGTDPTAANATDGTVAAWLLYRPTGAWVQISTQISSLHLGAAGCFNRFVVTKNTVTGWSGPGYWTRGDFVTFGTDTLNGLAARDRDGSTGVNLDLQWHTGVQNLGDRWNAVTLQRATVDYHQTFFNSASPDGTAFAQVHWEDSYRQTIVPSYDLPGFMASTNPTRVRPTVDCYYDCPRGDIGLVLESNQGATTNTANGSLDIYGAGIQYEISRDRRTALG